MTITTITGVSGYVFPFTVPPQCTSMTVEMWGADGTAGSARAALGGLGGLAGHVKLTFPVTPGDVLYFGSPAGGSAANRGGPGGNGMDLRVGGNATSNVVAAAGGAGGGGAGGALSGHPGGAGGNGGNPGTDGGGATWASGSAAIGGSHSTTTAPGAGGGNSNGGTAEAGDVDGVGQGGDGNGNGGTNGNTGGGGGGGRHGGGAGGSGDPNDTGAGGGGATNYIAATINGSAPTGTANNTASSTFPQAVLTYNSPPNQPTLTTPPNNSNVDQALAVTVGWTFSDPDPTSTQSSADVQWRVGTGAWTTITGAASTGFTYAFSAGAFSSFTGQPIEWQVRTTDNSSAVGPWSASSYFTPYAAPSSPTLTAAAINTTTPPYILTRSGGFTQWQARAVNDVAGAPGATIISDTGIKTAGGSVTNEAGSLPVGAFVSGTSYHIQGRVASPTGVWSAWVDSGVISASINAPKVPTVVLNPVAGSGSVIVTITNPTGDSHPPVANNVYRTDLTHGTAEVRIATAIAVNGTFTDWLPPLNCSLQYRVGAYTSAGAETSSA